MYYNRKADKPFVLFVLLLCLVIAVGAFLFCGMCFEYSLHCIFNKDVPWYLDIVGGVMLSVVNFPLAFCCYVLEVAGYTPPFLH